MLTTFLQVVQAKLKSLKDHSLPTTAEERTFMFDSWHRQVLSSLPQHFATFGISKVHPVSSGMALRNNNCSLPSFLYVSYYCNFLTNYFLFCLCDQITVPVLRFQGDSASWRGSKFFVFSVVELCCMDDVAIWCNFNGEKLFDNGNFPLSLKASVQTDSIPTMMTEGGETDRKGPVGSLDLSWV